MSEKRQSTLSEKITAAATVATALAAAKTAEEAAKSRREMEAMNQAMQLSSAKQEYIQLRMAAEQAESNFHNTLLAALPLLKNEEERVQFLTEKLLPKLKKENDVEILSPIKAISFLVKKESQLDKYLKNEAGQDLKDFLSAGKDLLERTNKWNEKSEMREKQMVEFRETQKELIKIEKPFGVIDFVTISLLASFIGFITRAYFVAPDTSGDVLVRVLFLVGGVTVFCAGVYVYVSFRYSPFGIRLWRFYHVEHPRTHFHRGKRVRRTQVKFIIAGNFWWNKTEM